MADKETERRLDKLEHEVFEVNRTRLHDALNMALECKNRLDTNIEDGIDRETRLRVVEAWMNEQKGKDMQNRLIMGAIAAVVSIVGTGIVEVIVRHL